MKAGIFIGGPLDGQTVPYSAYGKRFYNAFDAVKPSPTPSYRGQRVFDIERVMYERKLLIDPHGIATGDYVFFVAPNVDASLVNERVTAWFR